MLNFNVSVRDRCLVIYFPTLLFFRMIYKTECISDTQKHSLNETPHDKTNKITVRSAKAQISLDIRPVWSESSLFAWRKLGSLATHWAPSEDSDQTGRMPRLTRVFAGRTVILLVLSRGGSNLDYVKSHWYERVNDITADLTSFREIISKTRLPWGPITWLQLALQINGLHHVIDFLKAIGQ